MRVIWNAVLLATVIALGLAAMEMGVRILQPQQLVRAYTIPDGTVGTRLRPNSRYHDLYGNDYWVRINGAGFRQDDELDPSAGRRRVLLFGDSFTFGFGVNYEDSYFAIEKKRLEAADAKLQLLNAAVPAFSTGHVRKLMAELIPRDHPAKLIYFFNNNDILDNAVTDRDFRVTNYAFQADGSIALTDARVYSPMKRFLLLHTPYDWLNQHSHLFVLAKDLLKRGIGVKKIIQTPEIATPAAAPSAAPSLVTGGNNVPNYTVTEAQAREVESKIDKLVGISMAHMDMLVDQAQGLPLLVVWIPSPEEMELPDRPDLPQIKLFSAMRKALAERAARTGRYRFADITPTIPRSNEWKGMASNMRFAGDGHFNVDGNRWFADQIDRTLKDFLLAPEGGQAKR